MSVTMEAMRFAYQVHAGQVRKYTGNPYTDHLAEVAAIVASAGLRPVAIATAWLHDCIEDQGVTHNQLSIRFGQLVGDGVAMLSDTETGNRAARKAAARERLSRAWPWVQSVKVADVISNTPSIRKHDPKFFAVYSVEVRALLESLTEADERLLGIARAGLWSEVESAAWGSAE